MIGLLRIEARRSVVPPLLPVLAVLLSPLLNDFLPVAVWPDRSSDL